MRPALLRLPALSLLAALAATAAPAGGLGDMTEEERAAFRAEVRAYLMENPEVIMEAVDQLQAREEAAAAERDLALLAENRDAILNDPNSWVGGNPNGDITVVEFVDYRCGYCRKAHDEVAELVASDGNIRLVMKEFPILGEQSLISSQFAIAVRMLHGDEAYKAAHDALIAMRVDATEETLAALAGDLGHDAQAVLAKMADPAVTDIIKANHELATILDISGTPTFIIDETMVRGYVPLDGMRQIVAGQREG